MKKKRTRRGSTLQSGKHAHPRRQVTAPQKQWAAWDAYCARYGTTWAAKTRELWEQIAPAEKSTSETKKDRSDT